MPHLTVDSIAPNTRCSHLFPASGRQCRLLASDPQSGLCAHHLATKKAREKDADFFFPLMQRENRFQSADSINRSLNHLYGLLARDRISARRASTLAYISSLLLRTLPAIDYDHSIGVTDECPNPRKKAPATCVHSVPTPSDSTPVVAEPTDAAPPPVVNPTLERSASTDLKPGGGGAAD
jgi:hypothetical protein